VRGLRQDHGFSRPRLQIAAKSPDVTLTGSANEKTLFENDAVRVAEVKFTKGGTIPMHSHPDFFIFALVPMRYKSMSSDGKTRTRSLRKGGTQKIEAGTHAFQGLSKTGRALVLVPK